MAGPQSFTGKNTKVYAKLNPAVADVPAAPTFANLTAETALAGAPSNLVARGLTVSPIGTSTGAPTTTNFFGGGVDSTPGEESLNDVTIAVQADWSNALHVALRDAASGTPVAVALRSELGDGGSVVLVQGVISAPTQTHDPVAKTQLAFTVTPNTKPATLDK